MIGDNADLVRLAMEMYRNDSRTMRVAYKNIIRVRREHRALMDRWRRMGGLAESVLRVKVREVRDGQRCER